MPPFARTSARLLLVASIAALSSAGMASPASAAVADEIIVKRAPALSAAERTELRADAGVELERMLPLPDTELVSAGPGERRDALEALQDDPDVRWAEPNAVRRALTTDSYWSLLWGLENTGQTVFGVAGTPDADIDAEQAWQRSKGDGVTVAVVDTGAQLDHPDLRLTTGKDFVDGDAVPADGHGHGTHVSGTIAAAEDTAGIVGVAPQAQVMPLRVLGDDGSGTTAASAAAFAHAGDAGVRIVNASIGSSAGSRTEYDAIHSHPDTLYVVAAGNDAVDNDVTPTFPCNHALPNVLCVGASDADDLQASFSNYGEVTVDLHAPGVGTASTMLDSGYAAMDGTSMATPHVAGVAALLLAARPSLTAAQLKAALLDGADRLPSLDARSVTGGRLNAAAALALVADVATPLPEAGGGSPAPTAPVAGAEPPPTEPAPAHQGPAPTGPVPEPVSHPAPAPATLSGTRMRGTVRLRGARAGKARLEFRLTAPATVTLELRRRVCGAKRCSWRAAGRRSLRLGAGTQRIAAGSRLAGVKLRAGSWRATLATADDTATTRFTVRTR